MSLQPLSFTQFADTGTQVVLREAANDGFDSLILKAIPKSERTVKGRYTLQPKSFDLTVDRRDQATFKRLFKEAPDKTVGNGEVSLYWLFNYGTGRKRAFETRGGTEPDLRIDGKAVEVKAYPKHDPVSLGRFQDRRVFRSLLNTLFGISNLFQAFEGGSAKGKQTFKGELSFRYPDLVEAADRYIQLRDLLSKNKELGKFQVFRNFSATLVKFERLMNHLERTDMDKPNMIALTLMKRLIMVSIGDKPGDKGYVANLKDKDPLDIRFHYVDFKNITNDEKVLSAAGTFTVNGGVFKANFTRLFPGVR
jgi:hypothetical protein